MEAMKQASSFSAEDASAIQVPARKAAVRNLPGTKIEELVDPISQAKLAFTMDDQLPPLLSLIIDGLPPIQQSKYIYEAETRLHQYIEHYKNATFLKPYYRAGLSSTSYMHPRVISVDCLVAISVLYALAFLIDDLFFDAQSEHLQTQCEVSPSVCESPSKIQEYIDHLLAVFAQQVQPSSPAPLLETMMCESGRDIMELSNNPAWFQSFMACLVEHYHSSVGSHADIVEGKNLYLRDIESYAVMRAGNVGGRFIVLFVEFASNSYIPDSVRVTPYFENITIAASIHIGFTNDIFSYYRESSIEENPRNVITVLMECEGQPFVPTLHMAIGLTNAYARTILDLGAEAWNSTLRSFMEDVKALIAGNVYFSHSDKRYRQTDSCFPELRDIHCSWKIVPCPRGGGTEL